MKMKKIEYKSKEVELEEKDAIMVELLQELIGVIRNWRIR